MKRKAIHAAAMLALLVLMITILGGCGKQNKAAETAEPVLTAEPVSPAEPTAGLPEPAAEPQRQDGERFEEIIMIEGMEETVHYAHVRNHTLGFEMDYDYERFTRLIEADRECFVSVWDKLDAPENYLEITYRAEDAESAAAAVRESLSQTYDLLEETRGLERGGSCIYIEASVLKGTNNMADQLQAVYIIPAPDGSRVASAHYACEAAEGFGRRFRYMLNTFAPIERTGDAALTDEQALSAVRSYCLSCNPDLENTISAEEYPVYWEIASSDEQQITVLFRSYTGAQVRYYIDRASGDTYVTEFVPGITPEEERTDESFNVREYLA